MAGRPCSPRVLFVFESCQLDTFEDGDKTRSQVNNVYGESKQFQISYNESEAKF